MPLNVEMPEVTQSDLSDDQTIKQLTERMNKLEHNKTSNKNNKVRYLDDKALYDWNVFNLSLKTLLKKYISMK